MTDRRKEGRTAGHRVLGDKWDRIERMLAGIHPDLARYVREFAYGEVYARPGLGLRERELIALTALAMQGLKPQLETHVHGALHVGVSREEIQEAMIHLALYAGFPTALSALQTIQEVFQDLDGKQAPGPASGAGPEPEAGS